MRSSLPPKDNQADFFLARFLAQMCQVILIIVSMKAVLVPVLIKGTNVISTKCRDAVYGPVSQSGSLNSCVFVREQ